MKIIVGHSNMDLDCLGSLALARILYPDHRAVSSRLVHPAARNLHNLYRDHLDLLSPQDVHGADVESLVVVDTTARDRIREFLDPARSLPAQVTVYDHHGENTDIPGAILHTRPVGATTTLLGLEVLERGLPVCVEDATIALTGIYADTGNFLHDTVRPEDHQVAAYLLGRGASQELARGFLQALREEHQMALLHELLNRVDTQVIQGHRVLVTQTEVERQVGGLAAVAEKVFEIESPDALFALFGFRHEGDTLIVARSQPQGPDLPPLLAPLGGGGHKHAASALVRRSPLPQARERLLGVLVGALEPAPTAGLIMNREPGVIREDWTLLDASLFLEQANRTGAPVADGTGKLVGILTLRDIMKGRKAGRMRAPVHTCMSRNLVTARECTTLRDVETLFYRHNIGHLPILEVGRLVGLVTRTDYLRARERAAQTPLRNGNTPAANGVTAAPGNAMVDPWCVLTMRIASGCADPVGSDPTQVSAESAW